MKEWTGGGRGGGEESRKVDRKDKKEPELS